jgi:hypothetical protein
MASAKGRLPLRQSTEPSLSPIIARGAHTSVNMVVCTCLSYHLYVPMLLPLRMCLWQLDGTMSSQARDGIIKAFMTLPDVTVFLVSLKVRVATRTPHPRFLCAHTCASLTPMHTHTHTHAHLHMHTHTHIHKHMHTPTLSRPLSMALALALALSVALWGATRLVAWR